MKPGNTPLYINHNSNHPPPIIRSIPDAINKRLSNISSDKQSFESAVPPYQEALQKRVLTISSITIPSQKCDMV
jgi:hypothetical protein